MNARSAYRLGPLYARASARLKQAGSPRHKNRAFTMFELVIVMSILVALMAVTIPSLSRFLGGRNLTEESRRLLALTRYARSEAISRSETMEIWIDIEAMEYGLRPQLGASNNTRVDFEKKPIEFTLADNLKFEIANAPVNRDGLIRIVFLPDGAIDAEESPEIVTLVDDHQDIVQIAQSEYGSAYVLETNPDDQTR